MKPVFLIAIVVLFSTAPTFSQQKKVIKSQDDVPRFTYEIPVSASEVFASKEAMDKVIEIRPIAFSAEGWMRFGIDVLSLYETHIKALNSHHLKVGD